MIYPISIKPAPRIVSGEHKGSVITHLGVTDSGIDIYTRDTVVKGSLGLLPYVLRRTMGVLLKKADRKTFGPHMHLPEEVADDSTYDPDAQTDYLHKPEHKEVAQPPKEQRLEEETGQKDTSKDEPLERQKGQTFPQNLPSKHPKEKALEQQIEKGSVDAEAGDFAIHNVEPLDFPSDDYDDEGICPVSVEFDIKGQALAQLLGVQARVLGEAIKKIDSKAALRLLDQGPKNLALKELLALVKKPIDRAINQESRDSFNRGALINWKGFDFAESKQHWSAKVDPRKPAISYEVEFDVMWKWS
jgi:hypothetical protein